MYCPNCGGKAEDSWDFCPKCSKPLNDKSPLLSDEERKRRIVEEEKLRFETQEKLKKEKDGKGCLGCLGLLVMIGVLLALLGK